MSLAVTAILRINGNGSLDDSGNADVVVRDFIGACDGTNRSEQVLVTPGDPNACAVAVRSVLDGSVRSTLTVHELDKLPEVVAAAAVRVSSIGPDVLARAREMPDLSERRLEVLHFIAGGHSVGSLASKLHMSTATVKREIAALFDHLDVDSRVELVLRAQRLGLLNEDGQIRRLVPSRTG